MADDVLSRSATDIIALYRLRQVSPVEILTATLDRIDRLNRLYNAFVIIDREAALGDARASEERWRRGKPNGLIDGLPVTVKDLIIVKGMPTRRGSHTTDPAPSEEDGPPVARMRRHGGVFLGKTTTSEFGWKGCHRQSAHRSDPQSLGRAVDPWRKQRRSSCCGCPGAGHTPSRHGWRRFDPHSRELLRSLWLQTHLQRDIVHPHSPALSLWHQGPLTRTVSDAALMVTAMAGPDIRDWYAGPELNIDYRNRLDDGVHGCRIAYSRRS